MDLYQKTYFLITGASKGIGKSIALQCCRKFKEGSVAVLLARSKAGLEQTKQQIIDTSNGIIVKTYPIDLYTATESEFQKILIDSLNGCVAGGSDFERAIIVHNAGSVGDVSKKARDLAAIEDWKLYYHLNVFSVIALNCEFMKHFDKRVPKVIVNLTSKCGSTPFFGMAHYCSGKAAREMYFKVLALEESDTVVMHYSPGIVDTEMSLTLQEETINDDVKTSFRKQRETKTILTADQTTLKFLNALQQFKFQSGDLVDYFDEA